MAAPRALSSATLMAIFACVAAGVAALVGSTLVAAIFAFVASGVLIAAPLVVRFSTVERPGASAETPTWTPILSPQSGALIGLLGSQTFGGWVPSTPALSSTPTLFVSVGFSTSALSRTSAQTIVDQFEGTPAQLRLTVRPWALLPLTRASRTVAELRHHGVRIDVRDGFSTRWFAKSFARHTDGTIAHRRARAGAAGFSIVTGVADRDQEAQILSANPDAVAGPLYGDALRVDELSAYLPLVATTLPSEPPRVNLTTTRSPRMQALLKALDTDTIALHYQPKMHCRTNQIDGIEGLIRWDDDLGEPIPPDVFVPEAEKSGVIRALTSWTLERAFADRQQLLEQGHQLDVSVNLSAGLVSDEAFIDELVACASARAEGIGLEITETAIMREPERALRQLTKLSDAGFALSIDDYGSGMSSLAYLKRVPARELKIDRFFTADLTSSHNDPMLLRSSIELAHGLGMEVTAEGIETEGALALLRVMGCDRVQGYLTGRAMTLPRFLDFFAKHEHLNALSPGESGFRRSASFWQ
ncbi:MAG: EAL domain-containing protein [Pacificimonas sp.]